MSRRQSENAKKLICSLCCYHQIEKRNLFFAQCQHKNNSCIKCAQKYMLEKINQKKNPTCMVENCQKKMVTGQYSLYQHFNQSSKEKWKYFCKSKPESQGQFIQCKVNDCKGVIIKNRCAKCCQDYCEKCWQFSHNMSQPCDFQRVNQIDINVLSGLNIIVCPKCSIKFSKLQGCIHLTCTNCKFQFCEVCKKSWSFNHKLCTIRPKQKSTCCSVM